MGWISSFVPKLFKKNILQFINTLFSFETTIWDNRQLKDNLSFVGGNLFNCATIFLSESNSKVKPRAPSSGIAYRSDKKDNCYTPPPVWGPASAGGGRRRGCRRCRSRCMRGCRRWHCTSSGTGSAPACTGACTYLNTFIFQHDVNWWLFEYLRIVQNFRSDPGHPGTRESKW